jgi:hypothetical protein
MTTNFQVIGQKRQVGAIGLPEEFSEIITAESSKQAYNLVREKIYAQNYEHVLIREIKADWNNTDDYTHVESSAYLYSE